MIKLFFILIIGWSLISACYPQESTTQNDFQSDRTTVSPNAFNYETTLSNDDPEQLLATLSNNLFKDDTPSPTLLPINNLIDKNTISCRLSKPLFKIYPTNVNISLKFHIKFSLPIKKILRTGKIPSFTIRKISFKNNPSISSTTTQSISIENGMQTTTETNNFSDNDSTLSHTNNLQPTTEAKNLTDNDSTSFFTTPLPFLSQPKCSKKFKVYWNVPTSECHRYGLKFEEVSKKYDMIQNPDDAYYGKEIISFYEPGPFPSLIKIANGFITRNGGVPQKGDLERHLNAFKKKIYEVVDPNFSGLGIINFWFWRPIFGQNIRNTSHYRYYSYEIENNESPFVKEKDAKQLGSQKFETFPRHFLEETIKLAKKLRPKASWGYFSYPFCSNSQLKNRNKPQCSQQFMKENDRNEWLWNQTDILMPGIFIPANFTQDQKIGLINGRLNEARRIAKKFNPPRKIIPCLKYEFRYTNGLFLEYNDLVLVFQELMNQEVDGLIIRGKHSYLDSELKCYVFYDYLNHFLGSFVKGMINNGNEFMDGISYIKISKFWAYLQSLP